MFGAVRDETSGHYRTRSNPRTTIGGMDLMTAESNGAVWTK